MPSLFPRPHWIDVEVTGTVRGHAVDETVRVYVRRPEQARNTKAVYATAIRAAKERAGFHSCVSSKLFAAGLRDWSDSVDAATGGPCPGQDAAVAEILAETRAA